MTYDDAPIYRWYRLDPQDYGAAYRPGIGIPGGVHGPLYPLVELYNVNSMELREGLGGPEHDIEGEHVVYIYDSASSELVGVGWWFLCSHIFSRNF